MNKIPVRSVLVLLLVCSFAAHYNGFGWQYGSRGEELIQRSRAEFIKRLDAWRNYINPLWSSEDAGTYINNEPFYDLLRLGPVAIPWLLEQPRSVFLSSAVEALLRCGWEELAGISREQAIRGDAYAAFETWWKTAPEKASEFSDVRVKQFRSWRGRQSGMVGSEQLNKADEWRGVKQLGVLGIPFIIKRIKSGLGDEYDYRLMTYWTDPLDLGHWFSPIERQTIPGEKMSSEYWLNWWQENAWQYWWLPDAGGK